MKHRYAPLLLLALCLSPLAAAAGQPHDPPAWRMAANDDWKSLNEQERQLLEQHRGNWNGYSPEQKARLRQGAKRYQNLSPAQRQDAERGKERFETMSPQERRTLREKYNRSRER